MNKRERIMALCVVGALGGLAAVKVIEWTVVQPFAEIRRDIATEQKRRTRLVKRHKALRDVEQRWVELVGRTLADNALDAQRIFREDMHSLLELHGLSHPKINNGTAKRDKNGLIQVPLRISAEGPLKSVMGFLMDFYRREYLARLDKVTVTADQNVIRDVNSPRRRSNSRGRRGGNDVDFGPEGPELRLNLTAVTLVLPKLKDQPHPVAEEVRVADSGLLPRPLDEYERVIDVNLFEPYTPPVVVRKPERPPDPPPQREPDRPPPVDPRADARHKMLIATTSLDGNAMALVQDERKLAQPPEQYYEDDPIDDGRLLLIHPLGIVVRVEDEGDMTDYFYPIAVAEPARFTDREVLSPEAHPRIWGALEEEFVNWPGSGSDAETPSS